MYIVYTIYVYLYMYIYIYLYVIFIYCTFNHILEVFFLGARSQSGANVDAQTTKADKSNRVD